MTHFKKAGTEVATAANRVTDPRIPLSYSPSPWFYRLTPPAIEIALPAIIATAFDYGYGEQGAYGALALYGSLRSISACFGAGIAKPIRDFVYNNIALQIVANTVLGASAALLFAFGMVLLPNAIDPSPKDHAQSVAINQAGYKVSLGAESASECVLFFAMKSWGRQGKKLGEVCVTLNNIHRDNDNFYGVISVKGKPSFTQMFRPENSVAPGYQNARILYKPNGVD